MATIKKVIDNRSKPAKKHLSFKEFKKTEDFKKIHTCMIPDSVGFSVSKKEKQEYVISDNIDDHVGYTGQKVTISIVHEDGYVTVTDGNDDWYCGVEEIRKIN